MNLHVKKMTLCLSVVLLLIGGLVSASASADDKKPPATLKGILLEQLRTTHNQKEWFVPGNVAVQGLTAEQANWKDGKGNHSIGQLTYHLVFWNQQVLAKFKGEQPAKFSGNNEETFNNFDAKSWAATVQQLDEVMNALEKAVEGADEEKLKAAASENSACRDA